MSGAVERADAQVDYGESMSHTLSPARRYLTGWHAALVTAVLDDQGRRAGCMWTDAVGRLRRALCEGEGGGAVLCTL